MEYVRDAIGAHWKVLPPLRQRRQFLDGLKRRTVAMGSARSARDNDVVAGEELTLLSTRADNRESESKSYHSSELNAGIYLADDSSLKFDMSNRGPGIFNCPCIMHGGYTRVPGRFRCVHVFTTNDSSQKLKVKATCIKRLSKIGTWKTATYVP